MNGTFSTRGFICGPCCEGDHENCEAKGEATWCDCAHKPIHTTNTPR